jgi:ribose transport system substrate-binding protein
VTASSAPASTPIQIAFFNPIATNTYTAGNMKGLQQEADKLGGKITVFDAKFDPATQINQIQDATASGKYQIFVIVPLNNAGLVPAVTQARAKGIQVVSLLSTIGSNLSSLQSSVDGVITVGTDLATNGKYIADLMVKACADLNPCKVAYMPGDSKQATDQIRTNAVNDALKSHSSIQMVAEQPGGFDPAAGLATAQNILTAHPDLNVIAAASSQPIAGAIQAIDKANLTGKVKVVSNGGTEEDVDGIKSGAIFGAPVTLPGTEAALGLEYAVAAMQGQTVPTATDSTTKSPVGPILTKEILDSPAGQSFVPEWSAS